MQFDDSTYDLIEKHLTGDLSSSEKKDFDRLSQDPAFLEEVRMSELARAAIVDTGLLQEKESFSNFDFDKGHWKKPPTTSLGYLAVGALFIFTLGTIGFQIQKNSSSESESIVEKRPAEPLTIPHKETSTTVPSIETPPSTGTSSTEQTQEKPSGTIFYGDEINTDTTSLTPVNETSTLPTETKDTTARPTLATVVQETPKETSPTINTEVSVENSGNTCQSSPIKFNTYQEHSCTNASTGEIAITVEQGKAPYTFSLDGEETTSDFEYSFVDLSTGYYEITISDARGCASATEEVFIDEVQCLKRDHLISLDQSSEWSLDVQDGTSIIIFNSSGQQVYEQNQDSTSPIIWDLRSKSGAICAPGLYPFILTYQSGEVMKGSLTIVP